MSFNLNFLDEYESGDQTTTPSLSNDEYMLQDLQQFLPTQQHNITANTSITATNNAEQTDDILPVLTFLSRKKVKNDQVTDYLSISSALPSFNSLNSQAQSTSIDITSMNAPSDSTPPTVTPIDTSMLQVVHDTTKYDSSSRKVYEKLNNYAKIKSFEELPIFKLKSSLLSILHDNDIVLLSCGTGFGKSTQVPQYLLEFYQKTSISSITTDQSHLPKNNIWMVLPQKHIADSLAKRINDEIAFKIQFYTPDSDDEFDNDQLNEHQKFQKRIDSQNFVDLLKNTSVHNYIKKNNGTHSINQITVIDDNSACDYLATYVQQLQLFIQTHITHPSTSHQILPQVPDLPFSTLIVDEIHDRTMFSDVLLSLFIYTQQLLFIIHFYQQNFISSPQMKPKLIIMSATMNVLPMYSYFSHHLTNIHHDLTNNRQFPQMLEKLKTTQSLVSSYEIIQYEQLCSYILQSNNIASDIPSNSFKIHILTTNKLPFTSEQVETPDMTINDKKIAIPQTANTETKSLFSTDELNYEQDQSDIEQLLLDSDIPTISNPGDDNLITSKLSAQLEQIKSLISFITDNGQYTFVNLSKQLTTFPVDIIYQDEYYYDWLSQCAKKCAELHLTQPYGDIIVFLPSALHITQCYNEFIDVIQKYIQMNPNSTPLTQEEYESLLSHQNTALSEEQELTKSLQKLPTNRIYDFITIQMTPESLNNPKSHALTQLYSKTDSITRKIIFSTSICETSITIPTLTYIIDSGYTTTVLNDPKSCTNTTITSIISQSQAIQRAGRGGRTRPAICYRMYTKNLYTQRFNRHVIPEIKRSNLVLFLLFLSKHHINYYHCPLLQPPNNNIVNHTYQLLLYYNLINTDLAKTTNQNHDNTIQNTFITTSYGDLLHQLTTTSISNQVTILGLRSLEQEQEKNDNLHSSESPSCAQPSHAVLQKQLELLNSPLITRVTTLPFHMARLLILSRYFGEECCLMMTIIISYLLVLQQYNKLKEYEATQHSLSSSSLFQTGTEDSSLSPTFRYNLNILTCRGLFNNTCNDCKNCIVSSHGDLVTLLISYMIYDNYIHHVNPSYLEKNLLSPEGIHDGVNMNQFKTSGPFQWPYHINIALMNQIYYQRQLLLNHPIISLWFKDTLFMLKYRYRGPSANKIRNHYHLSLKELFSKTITPPIKYSHNTHNPRQERQFLQSRNQQEQHPLPPPPPPPARRSRWADALDSDHNQGIPNNDNDRHRDRQYAAIQPSQQQQQPVNPINPKLLQLYLKFSQFFASSCNDSLYIHKYFLSNNRKAIIEGKMSMIEQIQYIFMVCFAQNAVISLPAANPVVQSGTQHIRYELRSVLDPNRKYIPSPSTQSHILYKSNVFPQTNSDPNASNIKISTFVFYDTLSTQQQLSTVSSKNIVNNQVNHLISFDFDNWYAPYKKLYNSTRSIWLVDQLFYQAQLQILATFKTLSAQQQSCDKSL